MRPSILLLLPNKEPQAQFTPNAHRTPELAIDAVGEAINSALEPLALDPTGLRTRRREKFLAMGRET